MKRNKITLLLVTVLAAVECVALTPADLGSQHRLTLLTSRGYLPGLPMLVRIEVRNAGGQPERELWDADVSLVADNGVTLSVTNVPLRNGLGSMLVAFSDGGDFNLTAALGPLSARRPLSTLTNTPITAVGGSLSGSNVWSGVVQVTNDVTVPAGSSLTILSNTLVLINGTTSGTEGNDLLISGTIESLGSEDYPVTLTCNSTNLASRWGQIRHESAQPSLYRYTSIMRAGRAPTEGHTGTAPLIRPSDSIIRFENCSLTDLAEQSPSAAGFGRPGKIAQASGSDLTFIDCLFQRARMGPEIAGTALACINTWILDMSGPDDADGIYLHDQAAGQLVTLSGCVLARGDDDGIDTLNARVTVENCIIRDWANLFEDAKAISVFNGAMTVRRSLIVDSTVGIAAKWSGGEPTLVNIDHCTLTRNLTNVWANRKDNAPGPFIDYRITNSVLWGGDPVQSDFAPTNFTIGYSDISEPWPGDGNLQNDPLFVDAAVHDFRLQPYSPCIDSGDPAFPPDGDGSRTDLGFVTFLPPPPVLSLPLIEAGGFQFTLTAYSNREYVVEFSTNVDSAWSVLGTNFQTNARSIIQDNLTGARRFYRARLAP